MKKKGKKIIFIILGIVVIIVGLIAAERISFYRDPVKIGKTYTKKTREKDIVHDSVNGAVYVKNQLTVSAKLHTTKREMNKIVLPKGARVVGVISSISTFQIEFYRNMSYEELEEMAHYLNNQPNVEYATFNYVQLMEPN